MKPATMVAMLAVGAACGCRREAPATRREPDAPPPSRSAAATVVDGLTGRTAVRAGRKAEAQIRDISAEHNRDLDAVMGD